MFDAKATNFNETKNRRYINFKESKNMVDSSMFNSYNNINYINYLENQKNINSININNINPNN